MTDKPDVLLLSSDADTTWPMATSLAARGFAVHVVPNATAYQDYLRRGHPPSVIVISQAAHPAEADIASAAKPSSTAVPVYIWKGSIGSHPNTSDQGSGQALIPANRPAEIFSTLLGIIGDSVHLSDDGPAGRQIRVRRSRFSPDIKAAREQFEREFLIQALKDHHWNILRTAAAINLARRNLQLRMRKHKITQPTAVNETDRH